jgi:SAM-dependent methyltransferase
MDIHFDETYYTLEKNHFWLKARRDYLVELLKQYPKNSKILDIGSSSGLLLKELAEAGFEKQNLFGIDINEGAIKKCKENGIENAIMMDANNVQLRERFDIIISSDSLEHFEDDENVLQNWVFHLKNDGILVVFVPAFMLLWGENDVVNMHYKRYTRKELINAVRKSGLKISKSGYWNFFLFSPILISRLISRVKPSERNDSKGDLEYLPFFNNLFYKLLRFENRLLKTLAFPFGVSTYCIAEKSPRFRNKTIEKIK